MPATTRHMSTLGQANEAWALLKIKYTLGSQNVLLDVTGPRLTPSPLPLLRTRLNPPPLEKFARGLLLTLANRL